MSKPIISVEGRRVYVRTQYGDPCVPALKELGAHWDPESKRWWLGSAKKADVEAVVAKTAGRPKMNNDDQEIMVIGKAKYKGRNYYVRWIGNTKNGDYKARLCSLDGKLDFWVKAAQFHEFSVTGDGDVARVTKSYDKPRTLEGIRRYVEKLRNGESTGNHDDKPDDQCYRGPNGQWLVKGCAVCLAAGTMCRTCRHDIYDC